MEGLKTEDVREILHDIKDIPLERETQRINQNCIRIDQLFYRCAIKIWKGANFSDNKHNILKKTLIKTFVKYHAKS